MHEEPRASRLRMSEPLLAARPSLEEGQGLEAPRSSLLEMSPLATNKSIQFTRNSEISSNFPMRGSSETFSPYAYQGHPGRQASHIGFDGSNEPEQTFRPLIFLEEFFIHLLSPVSIIYVIAVYGTQMARNKHMLFLFHHISRAWQGLGPYWNVWLVPHVLEYYVVLSLYSAFILGLFDEFWCEMAVLVLLFSFRSVITALRHSFLSEEETHIIRYGTKQAAAEVQFRSQFVSGFLRQTDVLSQSLLLLAADTVSQRLEVQSSICQIVLHTTLDLL
jgi:hypothetical protein